MGKRVACRPIGLLSPLPRPLCVVLLGTPPLPCSGESHSPGGRGARGGGSWSVMGGANQSAPSLLPKSMRNEQKAPWLRRLNSPF